MSSSVETDLREKLETSSLQAAQHEIPIGKDAADIIKVQANESFKSKFSMRWKRKKNLNVFFIQMAIMKKRLNSIQKRSKFIRMQFYIRTEVLLIFDANGTATRWATLKRRWKSTRNTSK